jgi:hypothetical protein
MLCFEAPITTVFCPPCGDRRWAAPPIESACMHVHTACMLCCHTLESDGCNMPHANMQLQGACHEAAVCMPVSESEV